ncbi:MAG TPA: ubiquinol-cytochrome C chaperone family protein [Bosea sp. (in: a-proteobacteria)]|jgi:cytochrome b pre-mRNA-processing protein 3|uniref:ubiquinol-cytochrome C chaperone family protein n=1 Tax=Bosea sp. (in: a-proteobacteria) TaxID=1871050 RepID=UPI002E0EE658|nr:ubiquinol-cytochrome C chaperone family protein [Bosea sp. (in: a-proteobacteria)]
MFGLFGKRKGRQAPVDALFARIAEASRQPALYLAGGVPDSFEGRFESLTLHVFLVLRRLRELPAPAADLAQELVDACFAYLELGFRNAGISDIAVPKRMKKIGQMFYGRLQAYEAALATRQPADLVEALRRNASPDQASGEGATLLAAYVNRAQALLAGLDLDAILRDAALFPALVDVEASHDA